MNHKDKVAQALEELDRKGVGPMTSAPPAFRLAWKLGLTPPPPHFIRFVPLALLMGGFFALTFGGLMWFLRWHPRGDSWTEVGLQIAASGTFFGVMMAAYYRHAARKLRLPSWSDEYAAR